MSDLSQAVVTEGLRRGDRKKVCSLGTIVAVRDGRTVIDEGERNRDFYVIVEGTAVMQRNGIDVHLLEPGDWFGEVDAMTPGGVISNATVTALADLEVRVYDPREFEALLHLAPPFRDRLLRSVMRSARELVTVEDGDRRADAADPSEAAQRTQALHDSLT